MTMAQLWGGRFTKQTDQLVFDFNASITFDKRLFHEDVTGSIVHATMLAKQGILTEEERKSIVEGLTGILEDVDDGTLAIDETQEDIHSFVEATLIDRIGDAGKKLHTGRSRNDQGKSGRDRRTAEKAFGSHSLYHGEQFRYLHAGLHPFTEGTAHYPGASLRCLF